MTIPRCEGFPDNARTPDKTETVFFGNDERGGAGFTNGMVGANVVRLLMNHQESSTDTSLSTHGGDRADAISRRAYELWEKEGRPDGSDLRHWLQAEQELRTERSAATQPASSPATTETTRNTGTDTQPLAGTRAAAAANRENKRGSASPFGQRNAANNGTGNQSSQNARRKSPSAPVM